MKSYIPTINISSLLNADFDSISSKITIKKIAKACIEVGFFQIIGHGIKKKDIKNITKVGNNFFKTPIKNKKKLAPKKWNKVNRNTYRGYFPNDVNGKEGLDIGDLKVTKKYANNLKNQYIEYIDLNKSLFTDLANIEHNLGLSNYDDIQLKYFISAFINARVQLTE